MDTPSDVAKATTNNERKCVKAFLRHGNAGARVLVGITMSPTLFEEKKRKEIKDWRYRHRNFNAENI